MAKSIVNTQIASALWYAQDGRCFWCGAAMMNHDPTHPMHWSREHVVPRVLGGSSWVLAHRRCNNNRQPPTLPTADDIARAESIYAAAGLSFRRGAYGQISDRQMTVPHRLFAVALRDVWPSK